MRHVAPILAFGSWGWIWDSTTVSRIDGIVHKMVRPILGRGKTGGGRVVVMTHRDPSGCIALGDRSVGLHLCWVAAQKRRDQVEEWLQRHEATYIRRLTGRQSAAHYVWDAAFVQHIAAREGAGSASVGIPGDWRHPWRLLGCGIGCASPRGRPQMRGES